MGTSGQGRRGISRDGDERIDGQTDERYEDRIRNGRWSIGGSPASTLLPTQTERERRNSGISSRTPDLFEPFVYLSFFHIPSFFNFLSSFLFHRVRSFLLPPLSPSYASIDHDIPIFLFAAPSPPLRRDSTVHGTSPRLATNTQPCSKTVYTHTREDDCLDGSSGSERASIDRWKSGDPPIESRLEHLLFTLPRRSYAESSPHRVDPTRAEARLGRARPPPSSRRGCTFPLLVTPRVGTTGHPGGPLTRHDRPWDTGRNAPRSKTRPNERSSISRRTRPPRCFRVIRRETTTGFSTAAREGEEISMMMNFDGSMSGESREECC